jgi:hypothetical protein
MVTTKKGRPSDKRTMFNGTPILVVIIRPKRNAKTEENRVVAKSQKLDPILRIETKRDTNVKCMEM